MPIFIFILGLFVGSFLNLLIDRLPRGEQIWTGRSHCDKCKKNLFWFDLIPVLSWLVLKGRCRFCRSPIPFRNTLVEIITGLVFITSFYKSASFYSSFFSLNLLISLFLNFSVLSCLIVIFFVDLKQQIIPDETIVVGSIASLLLQFTKSDPNLRIHPNDANNIISHLPVYPFTYLPNYLFSAFGASAFFLLLYFITKKRGMGFGDVKLALFIGLFLGFPKTLIALYFAFLTGAFISVILILTGKKRFGQTIAFGPFLVAGTIVAYFDILPLTFLNLW